MYSMPQSHVDGDNDSSDVDDDNNDTSNGNRLTISLRVNEREKWRQRVLQKCQTREN